MITPRPILYRPTSKALRTVAAYGPAIVVLVTLLIIWQLVATSGLANSSWLPAPSQIIPALIANWDVISVHTLQTLMETVLGLAVSVVLGLVVALLLDFSPWVQRAIYPILITSQTIPMVALAPLFLLWFGFGLFPKTLVVVLYCFFPIAVACADGLLGTSPDLERLMRSMKASRWQTLWMVRLPGAMPSFFSGLRIAATYSVTGAIVGELVGGYQGLGIYMRNMTNARAVVLIFAAIVVVAVLSLLLFGLVSLIERIALPWYQGARARS